MATLETEVLADLKSDNLQCRLQAVKVFSLSETVLSVELFDRLGWLARNDPDAAVRAAAEQALRTTRGRMKAAPVDALGANLTPEMVSAILSTAEPPERQRLLSVLQQRDDASLLPTVLEALAWETDDRVIAKMLSLVGRHGKLDHVSLVRRFLSHQDIKVQTTALDAVGMLITGEPGPELLAELSALAAGATPDVRFLARRIVGRIRPRADTAEAGALDSGQQDQAMSGGDVEKRLAALSAIARSGDRSRAGVVAEALRTETDVRVLAKMVMVLKELSARDHVHLLSPLLKHPDPRVCANAVEAVVALASEDVLPSLFPLLAREDNRLRANLMLALYPRYPEQVMGYVRRMLRSDKLSFRVSGLYCAQFLDHGEMYSTVVELLQSEKEAGFFASLLDWVEKHGSAAKALRDLEDLAAVRVDRAAVVEERLARMRAPPAAGAAPRPAQRTTLSMEALPLTPPSTAPGRPTTISMPVLSLGPGAAASAPLTRARVTGTHQAVGGRVLSSTRVPVPSEAGAGWKKILLHPGVLAAIGLSGIALAVVLSVVRPPPPQTPLQTTQRKVEPDRRPLRAMVLKTTTPQSDTLEVVLFGSPYRMKPGTLKLDKLERGATVWLVQPQIVRDKDGSGWLAAGDVSTGQSPPTTAE